VILAQAAIKVARNVLMKKGSGCLGRRKFQEKSSF